MLYLTDGSQWEGGKERRGEMERCAYTTKGPVTHGVANGVAGAQRSSSNHLSFGTHIGRQPVSYADIERLSVPIDGAG